MKRSVAVMLSVLLVLWAAPAVASPGGPPGDVPTSGEEGRELGAEAGETGRDSGDDESGSRETGQEHAGDALGDASERAGFELPADDAARDDGASFGRGIAGDRSGGVSDAGGQNGTPDGTAEAAGTESPRGPLAALQMALDRASESGRSPLDRVLAFLAALFDGQVEARDASTELNPSDAEGNGGPSD